MQQIILNEEKYAAHMYESKLLGEYPTTTLFLIAKYLRQCIKGMGEKRTYEELNEFMKQTYPKYNPVSWSSILHSFSKKGKKHLLKKIDCITFTEKEINTIKELDVSIQRLCFTILCYSKYHWILASRQENAGWISEPIKDIFESARYKAKSVDDRYYKLYDLKEMGLLAVSTNGSAKIKSLIIDMKGTPALDEKGNYKLSITDFRELGNEWDNYLGKGSYIRCKKCGRLVRKNSNAMKYCGTCYTAVHKEQKNESQKRLRNEDQ